MSRFPASRRLAVSAGVLLLLLGAAPAGAAAEQASMTTEPKSGSGTATARHPATLVAVRVGRHDGYDRVVFEYAGAVPGYEVSYDQMNKPGSGKPVQLDGKQSLKVITRNTTGVRSGPLQGTSTNWTFTMPSVAQVNPLGSFEGVGQAGIGITTDVPMGFRVFTLTNPGRLVIDVAHPVPAPASRSDAAEPTRSPTGEQDEPQAEKPTQQADDVRVAHSTNRTSPAAPTTAAGGNSGGAAATSNAPTQRGPEAWQLGVIGGTAVIALTAAALIIRKWISGGLG